MVSVQQVPQPPEQNPQPQQMYSQSQAQGLSDVEREVVGANKAPIILTMPSGRVIEFKKPLGALSMKVATLLGTQSDNQALNIYYRMLLCISKIDGIPVSPPSSQREMTLLGDRLGDDFDQVVLKFSMDENGQKSIAEQLFGSVEDIKK